MFPAPAPPIPLSVPLQMPIGNNQSSHSSTSSTPAVNSGSAQSQCPLQVPDIPIDHEEYGPPAEELLPTPTQDPKIYEAPSVSPKLSVLPVLPAAEPSPTQAPSHCYVNIANSSSTDVSETCQPEKRKRVQTVRMNIGVQTCHVCGRQFYSESAYLVDGFVCSFECLEFADH